MRTARNAGERRPRGSGPSWSWSAPDRAACGPSSSCGSRRSASSSPTSRWTAAWSSPRPGAVRANSGARRDPLFLRTAVGLVMSAAVALFGCVDQVNLMLAGVFQDAAWVAGVKAFPARGHRAHFGFAASAVLPLGGRRRELAAASLTCGSNGESRGGLGAPNHPRRGAEPSLGWCGWRLRRRSCVSATGTE